MNQDQLDHDLINDCLQKKGHSFLSFRILVERYEDIVFKTAIRYLGSKELAEDITQEAFLAAYNNLEKLQNKNTFKSWLLRIAKNQCIDVLRSQKKMSFSDQEDELENYVAPQENTDQVDELIQLLHRLDPEENEILSLHYLSEMSIKELSREFNVGESAIKMRLMRAREKIEKMMAK